MRSELIINLLMMNTEYCDVNTINALKKHLHFHTSKSMHGRVTKSYLRFTRSDWNAAKCRNEKQLGWMTLLSVGNQIKSLRM